MAHASVPRWLAFLHFLLLEILHFFKFSGFRCLALFTFSALHILSCLQVPLSLHWLTYDCMLWTIGKEMQAECYNFKSATNMRLQGQKERLQSCFYCMLYWETKTEIEQGGRREGQQCKIYTEQLWARGSKVAIGGKCKTSYFLFMGSYPETHTRGSRRSDFESRLLAELENLLLDHKTKDPEGSMISGSVTPNCCLALCNTK